MSKVKPLSASENLLLDSFCGVLKGRERSDELFEAACDMLDGLRMAFMAARRIRKIKKELADAEEKARHTAVDARGGRSGKRDGGTRKRSPKPRRD